MTVVAARSYSRNSGETSEEMLISVFGAASAMASRSLRSWVGSRNENRQADRHRLEPAPGNQLGDALRLPAGQRRDDLAARTDALARLEAPAPGHQRRRLADVEVEEAAAPQALDLDDVARAPGGDEGGSGSLALQHRVRRHGGPER